jgi:hypothetical protein
VQGFEGGEKTSKLQRSKEQLYDKIGLLHDCMKKIPGILKDVGFEPVQVSSESVNGSGSGSGTEFEFPYAVKDRYFPLSPHSPTDSIPYMAAKNFSRVHRSMKDAFIRHGWKKEEVDEMYDEMEKEWEANAGTGRQSIMRMATFVGRKPLNA